MGKELIPPRDGEIEEIALREALEERYLQYALSTITGRAVPDASDGLKPVHRRPLHAMQQLHPDPGPALKKCARTIGAVNCKHYPTSDTAEYVPAVTLT